MSRFIIINNTIINVDNVVCARDNEGRREVFMKHQKDLRFTTDKTLDELLEILNDKKPSYDWIPCRERLPEQDEQVFVYLFNDSPYIAWYDHTYKQWKTEEFDLETDEEPKEWLPLPDPYEGEQNEW